jgi:hypothetical protein
MNFIVVTGQLGWLGALIQRGENPDGERQSDRMQPGTTGVHEATGFLR